mmetsp:Transcript_34980/g.75532  ORF Transcript_34980/g.75532 Transcript_34980/m.75532 type:complete len:117 (-) Transcript_34980:142-492(-)
MLTIPRPLSLLELILSMVCWIIFSDVLSKALVASSRKRNDAFFNRARAMAIRCFWPPLNCPPPAPTKVLYFSGRFSTKDSWASAHAFWKSSLVASGNPCMMLCRMELAKSTGSCPT